MYMYTDTTDTKAPAVIITTAMPHIVPVITSILDDFDTKGTGRCMLVVGEMKLYVDVVGLRLTMHTEEESSLVIVTGATV